jgi:hypothetical protein
VSQKSKKVYMDRKFVFGIYPGGITGTDSGSELTNSLPDDPVEIKKALDSLQDCNNEFWVRCYKGYNGNGISKHETPENPLQYVTTTRKLDLVISFQSLLEDFEQFELFVRTQVKYFGKDLAKIQITEEPNLRGIPVVDGDIPGVKEALVRGVIAAGEEAMRLNLPVLVGFNAVPNFEPENEFWKGLSEIGSPAFYDSLGYVGLDFFPDVFHPVPLENIEHGVKAVLGHFRNVNLKQAGVSADIPIHITENGWPTSPDRSEEKQALVLRKVIETIYSERKNFNIAAYELFSLRDSDSRNPDIFYQFGIMKDDYTPKPAFEIFKGLIRMAGE